jgi:hypothetical protein
MAVSIGPGTYKSIRTSHPSRYITSIEKSYDIFDHRQSAGKVNVEPERGDEQRVQR